MIVWDSPKKGKAGGRGWVGRKLLSEVNLMMFRFVET